MGTEENGKALALELENARLAISSKKTGKQKRSGRMGRWAASREGAVRAGAIGGRLMVVDEGSVDPDLSGSNCRVTGRGLTARPGSAAPSASPLPAP